MSLSAGARLGAYSILSKLGSGGMGDVYRARDTRLDRDVAIKVLPEHLATDEAARARFEREAKAIAALSHPNILAVYDVGAEGRGRVRRHGTPRRRDASPAAE
jgi:serine/threonine protein kinase